MLFGLGPCTCVLVVGVAGLAGPIVLPEFSIERLAESVVERVGCALRPGLGLAALAARALAVAAFSFAASLF